MIEELKASIELAKKGNKIVLELMNAEILQRGITIMRLFLEYPEEGGVLTKGERRDTQVIIDCLQKAASIVSTFGCAERAAIREDHEALLWKRLTACQEMMRDVAIHLAETGAENNRLANKLLAVRVGREPK